jgi:hypothetical protein
VTARDRSEASISAIFQDLKQIFDEISSFSGSNRANEGSEETPKYLVSKEEEQRFRAEVQNEADRKRDALVKGIAGGDGASKRGASTYDVNTDKTTIKGGRRASSASAERPGNPATAGPVTAKVDTGRDRQQGQNPAAFVMWSKIKERITILETRWSQARRDCRQAVLQASIPINEGNQEYLQTRPVSSKSGTAFQQSQFSPAKSRDGKRPEEDLSERIQQRSVLLHRVLGVSTPISWVPANGDGGFGSNFDDERNIGLDMNRIHILQKDLLDISGLLSQSSQHFDNPATAQASTSRPGFDVVPASASSCEQQEIYLKLALKAQDIALHLSSLVPLAALALPADSPLASSMTGLELLRKEVCRMCGMYWSNATSTI